jgi:hypothetical protein
MHVLGSPPSPTAALEGREVARDTWGSVRLFRYKNFVHPVRTTRRAAVRAVTPKPVRKVRRAAITVAHPASSFEGAAHAALSRTVTPRRRRTRKTTNESALVLLIKLAFFAVAAAAVLVSLVLIGLFKLGQWTAQKSREKTWQPTGGLPSGQVPYWPPPPGWHASTTTPEQFSPPAELPTPTPATQPPYWPPPAGWRPAPPLDEPVPTVEVAPPVSVSADPPYWPPPPGWKSSQ